MVVIVTSGYTSLLGVSLTRIQPMMIVVTRAIPYHLLLGVKGKKLQHRSTKFPSTMMIEMEKTRVLVRGPHDD